MARDMVPDVCRYLNNDFTDPQAAIEGEFTIAGGALTPPGVAEGQYFRLEGSLYNDGIYRCPAEGLTDETFAGTVWPMRVPRAVRELAEEISAWVVKYEAAAMSPYAEERLGDYAYKKAQTVRQASSGRGAVWQTEQPVWPRVFGYRLRRWRKIY